MSSTARRILPKRSLRADIACPFWLNNGGLDGTIAARCCRVDREREGEGRMSNVNLMPHPLRPLFAQGHLRNVPKRPLRPLGAFSNYVAEELSIDIECVLAAPPASRLSSLHAVAGHIADTLRNVMPSVSDVSA